MRWISLLYFFGLYISGKAQVHYQEYKTMLDGQEVTVMVKDGDTIIMASLALAVVTSPKEFDYADEREKYGKYRRCAVVVYPYAVQAVRLYKEIEKETAGMSEKEKRKYVKQISGRLKDEFEEPLKNLTRTQGFILTKMIEKNVDMSMYEFIKELRGGFTAFYWNEISKRFDYKLKDQYVYGADPVLDAVLEDFDLAKDLNNNGK